MKSELLTLISTILLLISCNDKEEDKSKPTPKEFSYLIGDWERTNEEDGKQTYEHWRADTGTTLHGLGYTLQDRDTIFKEKLRIFKKDSSWTLRVTGVNESPTDFKIISRDYKSFIAENPANEFPSKIEYSYFDNVLSAKVSGDAMEISFIFWRMEED